MFRGTEKTQTTNLQGRRKQWSLARALLDKQQRAWLSQSMEPSEPEHTVFKRSIGSSAEVWWGAVVSESKGRNRCGTTDRRSRPHSASQVADLRGKSLRDLKEGRDVNFAQKKDPV